MQQPQLGWWLPAEEVPHRLLLSAFPPEVELARGHSDDQDGVVPGLPVAVAVLEAWQFLGGARPGP